MKTLVGYMMAFLMAAGLVLSSCSPKDAVVADLLEVTPDSLNLNPQGGQAVLSISSDEDWLMRTDLKWVKILSTSGKGSAQPVKSSFTFDANTDGAAREGKITIKTLKGRTAEVKLSQAVFEGTLDRRGIATAEDLLAFSKAVNEGEPLTPFMQDGSVVLVNDIDASSIDEWIPAGTEDSPFTGVFDGNGYTVKNIRWTVDLSKYPDAGIIGYSRGASVSGLNVGISGDRMTLKGNASKVNAAAVVGYVDGGNVTGCQSHVSLIYDGTGSGADVRLAGICGFSSGAVEECENRTDILCPVVARAAGFVAYNTGSVKKCTNYGSILAESSGEIGPAWGCSYNKTPDDFSDNAGKGHVGDYKTYKDAPQTADSDAYLNAVSSPAREGYDMDAVSIDEKADSYYNWTEIISRQLTSGVRYTHYDCDNVPRKVHILEIDLSDPSVEVTTSYANDCVPNPNGNRNSNNGFKIRETLSQLCERKRKEGHDIIAGINTGFFDSNDGISRGFHIEEGEPVYINNPYVVNKLPNHSWGLTIYADGTAACGMKNFEGRLRAGGQEFEWHSMNDTIMRHVSPDYHINLYDSHYKRYPHASNTNLENKLAKNALYVVAEYVGKPMTVNNGYSQAKVLSVSDGRSSALSLAPYITAGNQVGIALSGEEADKFMSLVSVGSTIEFRCDMDIEGETTRPIYTQNSTMFHLLKDGEDNTASVASHSVYSTKDPMVIAVVSQDKRKIWLVEVDGRQGWYSTGINAYEMYRIAKKLGGYNMTRFDGGGSATMWVYDSSLGRGSVVNSVSDSRGERSCMNYILIKAK